MKLEGEKSIDDPKMDPHRGCKINSIRVVKNSFDEALEDDSDSDDDVVDEDTGKYFIFAECCHSRSRKYSITRYDIWLVMEKNNIPTNIFDFMRITLLDGTVFRVSQIPNITFHPLKDEGAANTFEKFP